MALHRRLQVNLIIDTQEKAIQIRDAIKSKIVVSDLWTAEDAQFKKNLEVSISKNLEEKIIVMAVYLFNFDIKAQQVFDYIKNNMPAGVIGLVSLHYCPEEGSIEDWLGCNADLRGEYQEVIF